MSELSARIEEMLEPPADQLLAAFFDPNGPFAGATFDGLPDNQRDRITPSDLVAVTLLDVRFEPRAVRALLNSHPDHPDGFSEALQAVPEDVDLWEATDAHMEAATRLYRQVHALKGVGPTKASKLLARKRPRLVPIIDSVIRKGLALGEETWQEMRTALQTPGLPGAIEALRPVGLPTSTSTLQLFDAAVWMRHSGSKNARKAQRTAGLAL